MKAYRNLFSALAVILIAFNVAACEGMLQHTAMSGGNEPDIAAAAAVVPLLPGDALPIMEGATEVGIQQAASGTNLAQTFVNGGQTAKIVTWPGPGNLWSFCILCDVDPAKKPQGQATDWKTMSDFVKYLLGSGWSQVKPPVIAPVIPILPVSPEILPVEMLRPES